MQIIQAAIKTGGILPGSGRNTVKHSGILMTGLLRRGTSKEPILILYQQEFQE
jgi:hypothetical protein